MTDPNEVLPPTPDAAPPAAPPPPEPDRTQEILDSARAAVAQAQAQAQAWQQVAQQVQYRPDAYQQPVVPEPDIEFPDPEVRAAAEKLVDRKLNQMASQMEQAYLRDKQTDMAWRAQVERERAMQRYRGYGWDEVGPAVDQYMAQVPLHLRAHPGAWDEAFKLILGEHTVQQRYRAAQRAPAVSGTGYAPPAPSTPQSSIDPELKAEVEAMLGIKLSQKDLDLFSKKTVTWDEAKGLLED